MSVSTQVPWGGLGGTAIPPIYRLSVAQYVAMTRSGILTEDDPVELLDGWLITKMPKNPPHNFATKRMYDALSRAVQPGWNVFQECSVSIAGSVPEPDVCVARGDEEDYRARLAEPQDLALVIEVADTSLLRDRQEKKAIYARGSVPVYWIVNLNDRRVEVYTDPTGPGDSPDYRQRTDFAPGEAVPLIVEGREVGRIAVADLLP